MKVFITDDSQHFLEGVRNKGWSDDFYLLYNEKYYKLIIYDKIKLSQDVNRAIATEGAFTPLPNLVIVNTISYEDIMLAIKELIKDEIINYFKACEISNDEIIYVVSEKQIEERKQLGLPYYINKKALKEFIVTD